MISDLLQKNPDLRPRACEALIQIDQLLIECSADKSRRRQNAEFSETGFSCQVLSIIEKSRPKRSLIFQVKFTPVVHLLHPLLFPPQHVIQMTKTKNETLLLTSQGTVLEGINDRPIKPISDLYGKTIVKIGLGNGFMFFLTDKGLLLAKGDPKTHCMARYLDPNSRSMDYVHSPEVVDSLLGVDVTDISTCIDHTIICSREGDAYSWGYNRSGCLGVGDDCTSPVLIPSPVAIPHSSKVTAVFTGKNSTVILDDKRHAWICGSNSSRKLGLDSPDDVYFPHKLSRISDAVTSVSLGDTSTSFLLEDGSVTVFGRSFGRENAFTRKILPKSFLPKISFSSRVMSLCSASQFFLALTQDNEVYFWGQRRKNVRQSESLTFCRTKSVVSEFLAKEDIIVGDANESLMEIVSRVGPDCPVLLLKEPEVRLNDFKEIRRFRSDEEVIQEPNLVFALYSSQIHLKAGETISFADILCFGDDEVYLMIETNCQKDSVSKRLKVKCEERTTLGVPVITSPDEKSTIGSIPSWVLQEFHQKPLKEHKSIRDQGKASMQEEMQIRSPSSAGKQHRDRTHEELSGLRKQNMQLQEEVQRLRRNETLRRGKKKSSFLICCFS